MANRLYNEALLHLNRGRKRDAGILLHRVLDLNPLYPGAKRRADELKEWKDAESCFLLGRQAAAAGRCREAIQWFRRAEAIIGGYPDARHWIRICEGELRNERAHELKARAIVLNKRLIASGYMGVMLLCSSLISALLRVPTQPATIVQNNTPEPTFMASAPLPDKQTPEATLDFSSISATPDATPTLSDTDPMASPTGDAGGFSTPPSTPILPPASTLTRRPTPTATPKPVIVLRRAATPTRSLLPTRTPTRPRPTATRTATRFGVPTSGSILATPTRSANPTTTATPTPGGGGILVASPKPPSPTATPQPLPVTLVVSADEYRFSLSRASVPAGATIKVTLRNSGSMTHHWKLLSPAGSVVFEISAAANSTASGTFVARSSGYYGYICDIAGHESQGMKGTLRVQ